MQDSYDYFSDRNIPLVMSDYELQGKQFVNSDYQVADRPMQTIPRDRLVKRQTYSQNSKLDNPNETITMNDGTKDLIIIGFQENGFA
jgi:hypothetical protein